MMTDSVADMLTRIRNANRIERPWVDMPVSRLKINLAQVLKDEGFVIDYQVLSQGVDAEGHPVYHDETDLSKKGVILRVYLKYGPEGEHVLRHIERVSKPGRRFYIRHDQLRPILDGLGISVLSTSKGVMSDRRAGPAPGRRGALQVVVMWRHVFNVPADGTLKTCRHVKGGRTMSRIGKQPIAVPGNVKVKVADGKVLVEGPLGKLELAYHRNMQVVFDDKKKALLVTRPDDERQNRSLHGLTRSLIANMVEGVTKGYQKTLKIEGVGYQAAMDKKSVKLTVGYANAIILEPPAGVTVTVPDPTTIVVKGADKQKVGQFAAEVRASRKPEPYKGKGVRYEKEVVRRKEGKSFTSGG